MAEQGGPILVHRELIDRVPAREDRVGQDMYWYWCPGCAEKCGHGAHVFSTPIWGFDGNMSKPTVSGSILIYGSETQPRCHSFIESGKIRYLEDSEHPLAGQTVPMVAVPEWLR